MKGYKLFTYCLLFLVISLELKAQNSGQTNTNESITLAQAYINLSLTNQYFDSLSISRISKILPYEERELASLKDKKFKRQNKRLYNTSYSLLFLNNAKLLYRTKNEIKRDELVEWKKALGQAKRYYKGSLNKHPFSSSDTSMIDLINFNEYSKDKLFQNIEELKTEFTPYFNNDIYPDFKRLFLNAKNSNIYDFLSLWTNASRYDLSLEFSILNDLDEKLVKFFKPSGSIIYELDLKHNLICRFIQLKYVASKKYEKDLTYNQKVKLHDSYKDFVLDLKKEKDKFIIKELNTNVCEVLKKELLKKYPDQRFTSLPNIIQLDADGDGVSDSKDKCPNEAGPLSNDGCPETAVFISAIKGQYFFPNPAPLASAKQTLDNYKPELNTLGQVNSFLSNELVVSGYDDDHQHYYYDLDGFALATSLEKFNKDGSSIDEDRRWVTNLGSDGKFSYYEIFKSLFFDIESEFRMFAFIVASKKVTIGRRPLSPGGAEELIENSYPSLPDNLKNKIMTDKKLTVLVYHFHQNDVGEIPELKLDGENINVLDYLKTANLENLIKE